jgi:hypothetical protein
MEKEDTVSVQWAQEDVETSYNLLNNNNNNNNNNNIIKINVKQAGIDVGWSYPAQT